VTAPVVADASPLIAFQQIGQLTLLRGTFAELHADYLLVDERAARRAARALGLRVIGTLGVLLAAKRKRLITEVRPLLDELLRKGFWVSPRLVRQSLLAAGEETNPAG
jgi:predicted nucleic acid-binding protein